jgi:hypothetical protein
MTKLEQGWNAVTGFLTGDSKVLILGGLGLTVLVLGLLVRRAIKGGRPDKWLTVVSMVLGFAWSGEAMWKIATEKLHLAVGFAAGTFIVFETMLAVSMLRAERNQKVFNHPGKYGKGTWLIAAVMGTIASLSGDSLVEWALRLAIPLLVTKQWWDGMTGDGVTKPADAITWTWNWRRILVSLGLAKPGEQTLEAVDRERQILNIAKVAHRLHTTEWKWRKAWFKSRLRSLSMTADDDMLDQARIRVERVWRSTDRTRPLEAHEHAAVVTARAEAEAAQRDAEAAASQAQTALDELAEVRQALTAATEAARATAEQVERLQEQVQRVQREATLTIEQTRHEAELAVEKARREAELAVEAAHREAAAAIAAARPVNGHHSPFTATHAATGPTRASVTSLVSAGGDAGADVALPATAQACAEWMALWVKLCQEAPAVARGQGISEDAAKEDFGVSVRHLRKVRNAASSGALLRHALELGATIPDDYVDKPAAAFAAAS